MTPAEFTAIRKRAGHTQASLAAWAGVTTRQVQMIEAGDRNPSGPFIRLMLGLEQISHPDSADADRYGAEKPEPLGRESTIRPGYYEDDMP